MFEIASQIVICLLLAAVLGMVIGYFIGRMSCGDDEQHSVDDHGRHDTDTHSTDDTAAGGGMNAPLFLSEPREGGKDNLTKIKGIGDKIEQKLYDLGIYHFDQIASWSDKETAWVDDHLAFRGRIEREKWVEQAKVLAGGGETEFSRRVDAGTVPTSSRD